MALDTGLIFGYNFDNNTNDVKGTMPLVYVPSNPFSLSYGKINYGIRTDIGVEIYTSHTASLNITNNFTISLWMRKNSGTSPSYVLSKVNAGVTDNNYSIIYDYAGSNILEFYAGGYSGTNPLTGSQMTITTGQWHHIVYCYDGTTWTGYKDGVQIFSVSRTFSLSTSGINALFYGKFYGGIAIAQMDMDMFYMWNRKLNAVEVNQLYNMGAGKQYPFNNNKFFTLL